MDRSWYQPVGDVDTLYEGPYALSFGARRSHYVKKRPPSVKYSKADNKSKSPHVFAFVFLPPQAQSSKATALV